MRLRKLRPSLLMQTFIEGDNYAPAAGGVAEYKRFVAQRCPLVAMCIAYLHGVHRTTGLGLPRQPLWRPGAEAPHGRTSTRRCAGPQHLAGGAAAAGRCPRRCHGLRQKAGSWSSRRWWTSTVTSQRRGGCAARTPDLYWRKPLEMMAEGEYRRGDQRGAGHGRGRNSIREWSWSSTPAG